MNVIWLCVGSCFYSVWWKCYWSHWQSKKRTELLESNSNHQCEARIVCCLQRWKFLQDSKACFGSNFSEPWRFSMQLHFHEHKFASTRICSPTQGRSILWGLQTSSKLPLAWFEENKLICSLFRIISVLWWLKNWVLKKTSPVLHLLSWIVI